MRFGRFWNIFDVVTMSSVVVCLCVILFYKKYKNSPPGPWGLPFIGFLYSLLNENVHCKYLELSKKYGKIFSITLGLKKLVIISDAKMIKEAFNKEEFSGKPYNEFYKLLGGYGKFNFMQNFFPFPIILNSIRDIESGRVFRDCQRRRLFRAFGTAQFWKLIFQLRLSRFLPNLGFGVAIPSSGAFEHFRLTISNRTQFVSVTCYEWDAEIANRTFARGCRHKIRRLYRNFISFSFPTCGGHWSTENAFPVDLRSPIRGGVPGVVCLVRSTRWLGRCQIMKMEMGTASMMRPMRTWLIFKTV